MALIRCPECGKEVSDQAEVCMSCGYPIQKWLAKQKAAEKAENPSGSYRPESGTEGSIENNASPFANTGEKSFTRRNRILGIIAVLLVGGVGIFFAVRALIQPDYYQEGLKVTKLMGEMLHSDDYYALMGLSDRYDSIRSSADTNDYDAPVAVYSFRKSSTEKFMLAENFQGSREVWTSLSPELQNQLDKRLSMMAFATIINSRYGMDEFTFSSVYMAVNADSRIQGDGNLGYLYVFEKGTPVMVVFEKGRAIGTLLNINKEFQMTQPVLQELFNEYGIEVKQIKP